MWKTAFAFSFLAFGMALGGCDAETQADFKVCESTYALCTTAACTPIAGETDTVSCACEVNTGYSAGEEPCSGKVETAKGTQVSSRYYPIKSYAACVGRGHPGFAEIGEAGGSEAPANSLGRRPAGVLDLGEDGDFDAQRSSRTIGRVA